MVFHLLLGLSEGFLKRRRSAWSFAKHPNDQDEMAPLYLSYLDLPPPLKQCFTSFSLIPEDFLVSVSFFVNSCIAERFVTSDGNTPMEDVAEGYWKQLVQRNLLQPHPTSYDESHCRMHDLLRSLAQRIAQDECFVGDAQALERKIKAASSSSSSSIKLRRLSIVDEKLETIPVLIMEQTSLRTLFFFDTPLNHDLPGELFRKLTSLRVLDLHRTNINNLPTSLGDLVHLRSLVLEATHIRELPESIGNLTNLQLLVLRSCKYLHSLPSGVLRLISLTNLDAEYTPLDGLPVGIGRLQRLIKLFGFVVDGSKGHISGVGGDHDWEQEHKGHQQRRFCTLEELKSLPQLKYLTIYQLEKVSNRAEARAAALEAKSHLFFLRMCCTLQSSSSDAQQPRANAYEEEDVKRIGEVFEELRPPPCLEMLEIHGYFGRAFPTWMMTPSSSTLLHHLRYLVLKDCGQCLQLPPLGMLPQLDHVEIIGASAVTSIGSEILSRAGNERKTDSSIISPCFPKLEQLLFRNMLNWEEWSWGWEGEDNQTTSLLLPSLEKLFIEECRKLRSLPESLLFHATALKVLQIQDARSLREVQNLPCLIELILIRSSSLVRASNFPALKYLSVHACEELTSVEGVDAVEHIKLDDREAESLPEWLVGGGEEQHSRFPSLHKLTLANKICRRGLPDWPLI